MRKIYLSVIASLLITSASVAQSSKKENHILTLRNGSHSIDSDNRLDPQDFLKWNSYRGIHYGLVKLKSYPTLDQQELFATSGIQFLEYFKGGFYLLAVHDGAPVSELNEFTVLAQASWGTSFKLLQPIAVLPSRARTEDGEILLNLHPFKNLTTEELSSTISSSIARIIDTRPTYNFITVEISADSVSALLKNPAIQFADWAYDYGEPENKTGRTSHRTNYLSSDNVNGIEHEGEGVSVMIQDDGELGPHIDRHNREVQFWTGNDGDHGDHCAGTISGAGNIDPRGRGNAPKADLYVYKAAPQYQGFDSIASHYNEYDILITSTSYSNGCNAGYTALARTMDDQIQQYSSLIHVFSAGNSGTSNCGYGAGNTWGNITGGHKVGKNVITVANLTDEDNVANSSSRGPAHDGRIKPDISAVGTSVYSTIENYEYGVKTGTSMSCPGVAGNMAALYDAYKSLNNNTNPESGLMKAIVLNTADDLGEIGPDFIYGWGRINARKAYEAILNQNSFGGVVANNDSVEFSLSIPSGLEKAKIMLYWTDPEASTGAATALINDLDFTISSPSTGVLLPYVLNHSPNPATLGNAAVPGADHLNNVEQIEIQNPIAGNYTMKVKGFDVPQGPQSFFISYWFEESKLTLTYPIGGESFVPFSTEKIRWDLPAISGNVIAEYSPNNGATWNLINSAPASQKFLDWSIPNLSSGEIMVRVSYGGQTETSSALSIISTPTGLSVQYVCPDSIGLTWFPANGATSYDVYRLGQYFMDSIGITPTNSFVDYSANPSSNLLWYSASSNGPNNAEGERAIAYFVNPGITNCPLAYDAGITASSPASGSLSDCFGDSVSISFDVFNFGNNPISSVSASASLGSSNLSETFAVNLVPNQDTTIKFTQKANFISNAEQLQIVISSVNDANSYNDTLISNLIPANSNIVYQALWKEDFESFSLCSTDQGCGSIECNLSNDWINETNGTFDDADWRVNSGGTPSNFTGPTADHTLGNSFGRYLYVEASSCFESLSTLLSPCIKLASGGNPELSFWYFMFGEDMGSLHLDVFDGSNWYLDAMSPVQGGQAQAWSEVTVDLSPYAGKTINLRFRGITGPDFRSDIAIDDIGVRQPPVANFLVNPELGTTNVDLTDLSSLADSMVFDLGDGTILNNVPNTHTYVQLTVYTLTQEVYNSAGADTMTQVLTSLGAASIGNNSDIMVYPNPAKEALFVLLEKQHNFHKLEVFSVDGTLIETVSINGLNKLNLDLRNYANGSYIGKLKGGNGAQFTFFKVE